MKAPPDFPETELPLFAAARPEDPAFLYAPEGELEQRFAAFHRKHPETYAEIERMALQLLKAGRARLSIAEIVEDLRFSYRAHRAVSQQTGEAFKFDNSYRAFYARLLIHRKPELDGVIELRRQTHARKARPAWGMDPDYLAGRKEE